MICNTIKKNTRGFYYNLITLIFILVYKPISAQTAGINYQALILNTEEIKIPGNNISQNEAPLYLEHVNFRFTITNDSNTSYYIEEQSTITDENGLISLIVGEGVPIFSSFNDIIWDGSTKFLNVEINILKDNKGYVLLDSQRILYLPQSSSNIPVINGLNKNANTIELGGALTKATKITTSKSNTLAITGLQNGNLTNDDLVIIDKTTGTLKKITASSLLQEKQKLIIANDGQTEFKPPLPIDNSEKINVYRNGVKIGFTILSTTTIKLETGVICYQNDEIRIVQFY
ncbi:hypothetical protein [Thalassobellus citreus]|uniref:hypothetical protein n=1 Tax=Thalassobellus citreus TaxID=3367752 RepID=UPI0037ACD34A